ALFQIAWKRIVIVPDAPYGNDILALGPGREVGRLTLDPILDAAWSAHRIGRSDDEQILRTEQRGLDVLLVEVARSPLVSGIHINPKLATKLIAQRSRQSIAFQLAAKPPGHRDTVGATI